MALPLRRVAMCKPEVAGWIEGVAGWESLGYFHAPMPSLAAAQHYAVIKALEKVGAEVVFLPEDESSGLTLDAVYAHDASLVTDHGAILMNMGKPSRGGEPAQHRRLYESLDIPVLGAVAPPGLSEAGDMVWIDPDTLLIGEGFRTNDAGIRQIQTMLDPFGVTVIRAALPYGPGPDACLHLMSLMSVLDERVVLVDRQWLSVATVQLFERLGIQMISMEESEREQMACNVLALGDRRLLAIAGNDATNRRLEDAGFGVETYSGSEISHNGSGGPTCLTRPIWRAENEVGIG